MSLSYAVHVVRRHVYSRLAPRRSDAECGSLASRPSDCSVSEASEGRSSVEEIFADDRLRRPKRVATSLPRRLGRRFDGFPSRMVDCLFSDADYVRFGFCFYSAFFASLRCAASLRPTLQKLTSIGGSVNVSVS